MAWERTGFTLLLVLIQSILVGLKLDNVITGSWWVVFVPAYVWVAIILIVVCIAWYNLINKENYREWLSSPRTFYFAATAIIIIVLVILIAVRVQNVHHIPWAVVFIPIYVYLVLLLAVIIYHGVEHSRANLQRGPLDATPGITAWLYWFWLLNLFTWGTILIILLAIKLDNGLQLWNYWAILSPLWVLLISIALLSISSIPFIIVGQLDVNFWKIIFYVIAYIAAVLFLVFLILQADQTIHWKWSIVFIPLYVLEAILLFYVTIEWLYEPSSEATFSHSRLQSTSDESL